MHVLWYELRNIKRANLEIETSTAFRLAEELWMKLPNPYKQELTRVFQKVRVKLESLSATSQDTRSKVLAVSDKIKYLHETGIPLLVGNISSILHKMEKDLLHA